MVGVVPERFGGFAYGCGGLECECESGMGKRTFEERVALHVFDGVSILMVWRRQGGRRPRQLVDEEED
jgi:hypothetical protein